MSDEQVCACAKANGQLWKKSVLTKESPETGLLNWLKTANSLWGLLI